MDTCIYHEPNRRPNFFAEGDLEWIYFLRGGDLVKIGRSTSWQQRVKDLRVGSPVPLDLIRLIRAPAVLERRLHARFEDLRQHGEWFVFDECIQDLIQHSDEHILRSTNLWFDPIDWARWLPHEVAA